MQRRTFDKVHIGRCTWGKIVLILIILSSVSSHGARGQETTSQPACNLKCQNGGTCETTNCLNNEASTCCRCIGHSFGELCESKWKRIFELYFIAPNKKFSNELFDKSSPQFKDNEKHFCSVITSSVKQKWPYLQVACRVKGFSNINLYLFAFMEIKLSSTNTSMKGIPSKNEVKFQLINYCKLESSNCSELTGSHQAIRKLVIFKMIYTDVDPTTTTEVTTTSAPPPCNLTCHNEGVCERRGCSEKRSSYCKCTANYFGDSCEIKSKRNFDIYFQAPGKKFSNGLLDKFSCLYRNEQKAFCSLITSFFKWKWPDLLLDCKVKGFSEFYNSYLFVLLEIKLSSNDNSMQEIPSDKEAKFQFVNYCNLESSNCAEFTGPSKTVSRLVAFGEQPRGLARS